MTTPRHDFYESGDATKVIISVYDRGSDPEKVKVVFEPRSLSYENGDSKLVLEPLRGEIDPEESSFRVGKVKVEITLVKRVSVKWATLEGDEPDVMTAPYPTQNTTAADAESKPKPKPRKNWDSITTDILSKDKKKSTEDDPNAGGDGAANDLFKTLYEGADDDTKKAMMKSYTESNGTSLSMNWDEVKKGKVETRAPEGQVPKKW